MASIDWDAIDEFVNKAEADDRMGDHNATVISVGSGMWPGGDKFTELELRLDTTRNMAKVRVALGEPMSKEELNAVDKDKVRGVGFGQKLISDLHKYYGVDDAAQVKVGMKMRVKVGPQKSKTPGDDRVFARVVAFKPVEEGASKNEADSNTVGF